MTGVPCGGFDFFFFEGPCAIDGEVVIGEGLRVEYLIEFGFVPEAEDAHMLNCKGDGFAAELAARGFAVFGL